MKAHTVKHKDGELIDVYVSKSRAIKLYCTQCMDFMEHPNKCVKRNCPLYPFRGKSNLTTDKIVHHDGVKWRVTRSVIDLKLSSE